VIIDLNGNGLDFIPLDKSNVHFDMNNDGHPDRTAWVGADDGILAIDLDGDKMITHRSEFVFTDHAPEAKTDLEALKTAFDTDNDNYLTPKDERWSQFGIWQDANSDGKTDEGEFKTLDELSVSSISLISDGEAKTPADGVFLFGTSEVEFVDGSKTQAGDVAFSYIPLTSEVDSADVPPAFVEDISADNITANSSPDRFMVKESVSYKDMINGEPIEHSDLDILDNLTSKSSDDSIIGSDSNGEIWHSDIDSVALNSHIFDNHTDPFPSGEDMVSHSSDSVGEIDIYDDGLDNHHQ
ncbi:MAG: hypothetical protein HQK64_13940, partial [Desulfamplus sp.]|nr:hypothetical protein [Desulfamplus sp.]